MKRLVLGLVAVTVLAIGASGAFAGGSCCPKKSADAAQGAGCDKAAMSKCSEALSALNLTDEQKARVDELMAACSKDGASADSCKQTMTEIRGLLTAEQITQFDDACGKKAGCGDKVEKTEG